MTAFRTARTVMTTSMAATATASMASATMAVASAATVSAMTTASTATVSAITTASTAASTAAASTTSVGSAAAMHYVKYNRKYFLLGGRCSANSTRMILPAISVPFSFRAASASSLLKKRTKPNPRFPLVWLLRGM